MENNSIFAIEQFLLNKQYNDAAMRILHMFMDFRKGHHFASTIEASKTDPELTAVYTRLANCLCDLFLNYSQYRFGANAFNTWLAHAREIRAVFLISGFYHTDFLVGLFNIHFQEAIALHSEINNRMPDIEQLAFRLLLFSMLENENQGDLTIFFKFFPAETSATILSLLSGLVVVTPKGSANREKLFNLVPLLETYSISDPINLLDMSVVWMLCSYVMRRDKHAVKYYLNRSIGSWLIQKNVLSKHPIKKYDRKVKKPKVVVVLEYFRSWHSMGRSYGVALKSLREKFELIGIALQEAEVEDGHYTFFDKIIFLECFSNGILLDHQKLRTQLKKIERIEPDIVFYPSLGMHQLAIVLSNIRLAPIQIISFGHPASSFCDTIDYGIIEADYAPDAEELFSEKLILLPPESFVSQPIGHMDVFSPTVKEARETICIGISSSLPKISANFLAVCKSIAEQSKRKLMFLFFLNETEVFYLQCKKDILNTVPDAQVLHRLPPPVYLENLARCDLYLSTFPFGGANSVIDAMCVGLPVVCLRGEDIAGRTDSALISRRGVPDWLVAKTEEEYIAAALRLIHNDEERLALNELVYANSKELFPEHNPNFKKNEHSFATAFWQIFQKHQELKSASKKSFSLEELTNLI